MGQILHGSATTTHAVRAAIQRSKAPLKELAAQHGLNQKTVAKSNTFFAWFGLCSTTGAFRWPALCFALGAVLIMGEIILAEVVLSQIGNILILVAGIAFAWLLLRDREVLRPAA